MAYHTSGKVGEADVSNQRAGTDSKTFQARYQDRILLPNHRYGLGKMVFDQRQYF